jgi:hypothetical protein
MRQRESEFSMSQASCASTSFLPDFYRPAPDEPGQLWALGPPEHHQCRSDITCWISSDADGRRLHLFKPLRGASPAWRVRFPSASAARNASNRAGSSGLRRRLASSISPGRDPVNRQIHTPGCLLVGPAPATVGIAGSANTLDVETSNRISRSENSAADCPISKG